MDLTKLTDDELDALQLAVNTEIGARRQKALISDRFAQVIGEAMSHGLSEAVIEAAVEDGKAIAEERKREKADSDTPKPVVSDNQTKRRATNTIDNRP